MRLVASLRGALRPVRRACALVSVEPSVLLFVVSSTLTAVATQNLLLEKACRVNLALGEAACDALAARNTTAEHAAHETAVQQLTAAGVSWRSLVQCLVPALTILFVGSWSDRRGRRKPCMLVPIAGEVLNAVGHLICTFFYLELPIEADLICEAVFPSLSGGWYVLFMAAYTHVASVTSEADRSLRIGLVCGCALAGIPIGTALSGVLFDLVGFYGVFSLGLALNAASLVACCFLVKETPKPREDSVDEAVSCGVFTFLKDLFDVTHLRDVVVEGFGRGAGRRIRVSLILLVVWLQNGSFLGERQVQYLSFRLRFNWDGLTFSYFSTYMILVNLAGMALSVGVFTSWLKLNDSIVGLLACTSKVAGSLVYALAPTVAVLMFAPVTDCLRDSVSMAVLAMSSKIVPVESLGKTNSLIGVTEALAPLVCGPLYSAVYYATLDGMPGAFYLLTSATSATALCIFGWFCILWRREQRQQCREETTTTTTT